MIRFNFCILSLKSGTSPSYRNDFKGAYILLTGDQVVIGKTTFVVTKISKDISYDSNKLFIALKDKEGTTRTYQENGLIYKLLENDDNDRYKINTSFLNTNFSRQKNSIRNIDQFDRNDMIRQTERLILEEKRGENNRKKIEYYNVMLHYSLRSLQDRQSYRSRSVASLIIGSVTYRLKLILNSEYLNPDQSSLDSPDRSSSKSYFQGNLKKNTIPAADLAQKPNQEHTINGTIEVLGIESDYFYNYAPRWRGRCNKCNHPDGSYWGHIGTMNNAKDYLKWRCKACGTNNIVYPIRNHGALRYQHGVNTKMFCW